MDEGEKQRGRKEPSLDEEPTVRRRSRGQKGRNSGLSSWKRNGSGRKEAEARGKPGREADERKQKRREAPVERLWERNREGKLERSGGNDRGKPGSESGMVAGGSHCEAESGGKGNGRNRG